MPYITLRVGEKLQRFDAQGRDSSEGRELKAVRNSALPILIALSLGSSCAQAPANNPLEPATIGDVFLLDSSSQALKALPSEPWKAVGKPGWSTATGSIQVSGESSPFRVKAGDTTDLVFRVGNPDAVRLYQFTVKKHTSEFELVKVKGGFHQQRQTLDSIPADITKFGESSFQLIPKSPLGPGEYAIDASGRMFTFGIDP